MHYVRDMAAGFVQARRRKIKRRAVLWGSVAFMVSLGVAVAVSTLLGSPLGGLPAIVILGIAAARLIDGE
jgi:hypothetical protein